MPLAGIQAPLILNHISPWMAAKPLVGDLIELELTEAGWGGVAIGMPAEEDLDLSHNLFRINFFFLK